MNDARRILLDIKQGDRKAAERHQPLVYDQRPRRSPRARWFSRVVRRHRYHQRVFAFVARAARLDCYFKIVITTVTLVMVVALLGALPSGRYSVGWVAAHSRWFVLRSLGLEPDRAEIDADWRRSRMYDIEKARASLEQAFAEYSPPRQRLLRFAGMDPEYGLLRWGNFDRTVLLPSTVFEADESGRSYRLRPNVRSIWVRGFPNRGPARGYFQIPDTPEVTSMVQGTGVVIVAGSQQRTNSWGLRGPEPDLTAPFRGIVLGDSFVQGIYVGDNETPVECLKSYLAKRLNAPTEILNTGHLGYSPEQYYFTLLEYEPRFHPQFIVVSIFANDFAGDLNDVLEGRGGDWEEGRYWLGRIREFCKARGLICLYVPVPWINQIEGPLQAGFYPGPVSNLLGANGLDYLDPINEFANAFLRLSIEAQKNDTQLPTNPLFNARMGDNHFSARGCEVWAEAVGMRLALMIEQALDKRGSRRPPS